MNKVVELKKDLSIRSLTARAKKEADEMILIEGIKHTLLFKAPNYYDLFIIELKNNKWDIRKCEDFEWTKYYYEFIYNKEKFNLNK